MLTYQTIQNEAQYQAAVARISELMDAEEGTPEIEELRRLGRATHEYGEIHYSIGKPDPAAVLKYTLDSERTSLQDMIDIFGSRTALVNVLTRRAPVEPETAATLHERLGLSMERLTAPFDSPPGWFSILPGDMPWRKELKDAVTAGTQT